MDRGRNLKHRQLSYMRQRLRFSNVERNNNSNSVLNQSYSDTVVNQNYSDSTKSNYNSDAKSNDTINSILNQNYFDITESKYKCEDIFYWILELTAFIFLSFIHKQPIKLRIYDTGIHITPLVFHKSLTYDILHGIIVANERISKTQHYEMLFNIPKQYS